MGSGNYRLFENNFNSTDAFRNTLGNDNSARKILLFGCSYAYGVELEDKDTFAGKLSEKLNAKVYNRSFPGWGMQHMLYQIKEDSNININSMNDNIDTIIFVFYKNQIKVMNNFYWASPAENIYNVRYQLKDGKLEKQPIEHKAFHTSAIAKFIHNFLEKRAGSDLKNPKNRELMQAILTESREKLNEKYPNARFIFLSYYIYNDDGDDYREVATNAGWEYIDPTDFLEDDINICSEEYHLKNSTNPSGEAWELVANSLINNKII